MKRIICIFLVAYTTNMYAQDRINKISIGATFSPQAAWSFDRRPPKKIATPLFGTLSYARADWLGIGFYNFANNNVGFFLARTLTPTWLTYGIISEPLSASNGYLGIGTGLLLRDGDAVGFIEIGTDYHFGKPTMYVGMFIPFTYTVKEW